MSGRKEGRMLLRCFGNGMCYKGLCHLSWEIIPQSPTPHGQGQVQCNQRWHGVRKRLKCCSRVRMKCVGQANAQWWGRGGGCRQPWQRAEQSKVSIFQCPAGPSNSFRKMPWLKEGTHAEGERSWGTPTFAPGNGHPSKHRMDKKIFLF